MSKFDNIKIPDNIDEVTKKAVRRGINYKRRNKYKKIIIASVASLGLIVSIGISNPSLADNIPILGDVIEKISNALKSNDSFKDNINDINQSSTYEGLTITIDKAMYDGNKIYIEWTLNTEIPFKETEYMNAIESYEDKNGNTKYKLNNDFPEFKINGMKHSGYSYEHSKVKFVDDRTLQGNIIFEFDVINQVDLDTIDFEMEFGLRSNELDEKGNNKKLDGKWSFNFPVSSNKEDTKSVAVNKTKGEFTLHQVLLTPISVSIDITAPKEYYNSFDIMESVEIRDDKGNTLWATSGNYQNYDDIENDEISKLRYRQRYDLVSIGDNIKYIEVIFYGKWNEENKSSPILEKFKVKF